MKQKSAHIINGKELAYQTRQEVARIISQLVEQGHRRPCLAVILVGDDPASHVYVRQKQKACESVGIESRLFHRAADFQQTQLLSLINELNHDPAVDGILLQLPLPGHLDRLKCIAAISAHKDVDGLTPLNQGWVVWGRPQMCACTPLGIMEMIYSVEKNLSGLLAALVGRSPLVGRPLGFLLEDSGASIIALHSRSKNCAQLTKQADIVVVATGVKHLVDASWIKPGAIVIDVGIHRDGNKLTGDVQFDSVKNIAGAISPVPGGVGPMTIAMLIRNCLKAYAVSLQLDLTSLGIQL